MRLWVTFSVRKEKSEKENTWLKVLSTYIYPKCGSVPKQFWKHFKLLFCYYKYKTHTILCTSLKCLSVWNLVLHFPLFFTTDSVSSFLMHNSETHITFVVVIYAPDTAFMLIFSSGGLRAFFFSRFKEHYIVPWWPLICTYFAWNTVQTHRSFKLSQTSNHLLTFRDFISQNHTSNNRMKKNKSKKEWDSQFP